MGFSIEQQTQNNTGADMKGHDAIIAMRKAGRAPAIVFLNDFPCQTDWTTYGDHATVQIEPAEQPQWLDLRFLVGLRVSITSDTEKRAKRLFEACKAAGADTVAACVTIPGDFVKTGWAEIWRAHG